MERRLTRYRIPNQLTIPGDPASALSHAVRKHHASVIVMGAVSRSGLKRFFIGKGNSKEALFDANEFSTSLACSQRSQIQATSRERIVFVRPCCDRAKNSVGEWAGLNGNNLLDKTYYSRMNLADQHSAYAESGNYMLALHGKFEVAGQQPRKRGCCLQPRNQNDARTRKRTSRPGRRTSSLFKATALR